MTDAALVRHVKRAQGANGTIAPDLVPASARVELSALMRGAIDAAVTANDSLFDNVETGFVFGDTAKGQALSWAVPAQGGPENPPAIGLMEAAVRARIYTVQLAVHVHPSMMRGSGFVFRQGPSWGTDPGSDNNGTIARVNVVVGGGDRNVYFYNGTAVYATVPLAAVLTLRR